MPTGLAFHVGGRVLYVSDTHNHVVRAIPVRPGRTYQAEEYPTSPVASLQGVEAYPTCVAKAVEHAPSGLTPLMLGSKFCDGSTGHGYAMYQNPIEDRIDFLVDGSEGPYKQ